MFAKIAVATDGSSTASKAVDVALDLAHHYQASLLILSAYAPADELKLARDRVDAPDDVQWMLNPNEEVNATLANAMERANAVGVKTETAAGHGDPAAVICELASQHQVDLLVIGNKGMKRRILGSVPKTISQNAPCHVVIAKTT